MAWRELLAQVMSDLVRNSKEMTVDKVSFVDIEQTKDLTIAYAVIEHADGSYTTMTKARYEELEAAKAIGADEAKTK